MLNEYKCDLCGKKPDLSDERQFEGNAWKIIFVGDISLLLCGLCGKGLNPGSAYSAESTDLTDDIKGFVARKKAGVFGVSPQSPSDAMIEALLHH